MLALCGNMVLAAGNMQVDGSFGDWEDISQTDVSAENTQFAQLAMVQVGDMIYIHGTEKQNRNIYETSWAPFSVMSNNKETKYILTPTNYNPAEGTAVAMIMRTQSNYGEVSNATCSLVRKNNVSEWELSVPATTLGTNPTIQVGNTTVSLQTLSDTSEATTENTTTETTENNTGEGNTQQPSTGDVQEPTTDVGIVIDGYFDDWKDKPHSFVTNWNMPQDQRNENNCRKISMVTDGVNVYIHIEMVNQQDYFTGAEHLFYFDGQLVPLHVTMGGLQAGTSGIHEVPVIYKNGSGVGPDMMRVTGAKAYVSVVPGQADNMEMVVPIQSLKERYPDLDLDDISKIEYRCPSICIDKVVATGTSTGWIVMLVIGSAIALGGYGFYRKRKVVSK